MILKRLSILNYKNIAEAEMTFSPKINCLIGSNGEGKTNILDSIYFLSFTKSATNAIDSMNVRHGEEVMMVHGLYDLNETDEDVNCAMKLHQRKRLMRNKKEYKRMTEHIGLLPLVMVSPNDIFLVSGGSEERRKFIDGLISQLHPDYLFLLSRYNQALTQRNKLLRQEEEPDFMLMDTYETMMAETGERIYAFRKELIDQFIPVFQRYYLRIAGSNETVNLTYTSHCMRGPLLDIIQRDRSKDRAVGYSLHGIHKDELEMTLGGYPLKKEASQGQNKTYLVALKLAQFEFLKQTGSHTTPLLLLDDIFDKLDANRVESIVNLVSDDHFGQIFITDTNRENLDKILQRTSDDYKIFHVKGGEVSAYPAHSDSPNLSKQPDHPEPFN